MRGLTRICRSCARRLAIEAFAFCPNRRHRRRVCKGCRDDQRQYRRAKANGWDSAKLYKPPTLTMRQMELFETDRIQDRLKTRRCRSGPNDDGDLEEGWIN